MDLAMDLALNLVLPLELALADFRGPKVLPVY